MKIAGLIFTIIFVLVSILELFFCYLEKEKERKITKTFCLLSLTLAVAFLLPNHPLIYCGILFGCIGDLFLIFNKKLLFVLGTISFLIGHIFYMSELFVNFLSSLVPWYFYLIFVLTFIIISICLIKPLSLFSKDKVIFVGGSFYFGLQITAFILMITTCFYYPTSYLYFGVAGYIFFLTSDFILIYNKFIKAWPKKDFPIMLTYLLAQLLISLGFFLTLGL